VGVSKLHGLKAQPIRTFQAQSTRMLLSVHLISVEIEQDSGVNRLKKKNLDHVTSLATIGDPTCLMWSFGVPLNKRLAYTLTLHCPWTTFFRFMRQRILHESRTLCC
jgi:hypothetical protein